MNIIKIEQTKGVLLHYKDGSKKFLQADMNTALDYVRKTETCMKCRSDKQVFNAYGIYICKSCAERLVNNYERLLDLHDM